MLLRHVILSGCVLGLLSAGTASGQTLIAFDDAFAVPYGQALVVDAFGVLENDLLDGENAGESGAVAQLVFPVSPVAHGTLVFASDGSFTYTPGASFDGNDSFVYEAVFGGVTSQATVTLSACSGGPTIFTCWKENEFLALAAAAGQPSFQEGFEDPAVWGIARSPVTVPSVSSLGFTWKANEFDPTHLVDPYPPSPPPNDITTGTGPARSGLYGVFDLAHGYAVGSVSLCDVDAPPPECFYHDGLTIVREPGSSVLHGAGGYFTASSTGDVAIVLDGDWQNPIGGGRISGFQFFGVVDTGPFGFFEIQFREVDGRISDAFLIFADDFTLLAEPTLPRPPQLPGLGGFGLAALVAAASLPKNVRRK